MAKNDSVQQNGQPNKKKWSTPTIKAELQIRETLGKAGSGTDKNKKTS